MSANRKLQTEIQQVLKKIEEGVELFDEIWEKVYAAEQQSLKEKYEADLKKEIKKLQRLRDQVKTWLGSSEIKDKAPLQEARKVIETKMEQFKVCEKDTKTKAYSKEGLARASSNDPKDIEREEKRNWTNECLERLNDIIDSIEADIERISSGKVKSKNKEQLEKLENRIKKNRWHIARLEQIIKLLDNEELDPSKLDSVKDDVEYYIETAKEDDGALSVNDEFDIYEGLELDAVPAISVEKDTELADEQEIVSTISIVSNSTNSANEVIKAPNEADILDLKSKKVVSLAKPTTSRAPGVIASLAKPSPKVTSNLNSPSISALMPAKVPNSPSINSMSTSVKVTEKKEISPKILAQNVTGEVDTLSDVSQSNSWASMTSTRSPTVTSKNIEVVTEVKSNIFDKNSISTSEEENVITLNHEIIPDAFTLDDNLSLALNASDYNLDEKVEDSFTEPQSTSSYSKLIGNRDTRPLPIEFTVAPSHMLKCSMLCTPEAYDGDKTSSYLPRNPYPSHPSFPTQPLPLAENPAFFEKVPLDTLFLAFYYQQGSIQQYFAAKKLKMSSWRFHKKYLTWFQRHEEPKITTDQYEEGKYVYFDHDSGWCQRLKADFKFEYNFLEDELV